MPNKRRRKNNRNKIERESRTRRSNQDCRPCRLKPNNSVGSYKNKRVKSYSMSDKNRRKKNRNKTKRELQTRRSKRNCRPCRLR
jgi:hypothetical protein